MAYVRQHRNAAGTVVSSVFDRVTTEGDAARFNSAKSGNRVALEWSTGSSGTSTYGAYRQFELPTGFSYIVRANQLNVWLGTGTSPVAFQLAVNVEERVDMAAFTTALTSGPFFEEMGSSTVRVYAASTSPSVILFEVPHTSLPASSREKIIVEDQGNNEAVELLGYGDGIVMRSPNGAKWLVRIDDSGTLVVEPRG